MALGVPDRLRPRIFSTFGTTRVVGRQPNAPLPQEKSLVLIFRGWFCRKKTRKKSHVTPPGIDPGTVRLVAQRLNHYATPGPNSVSTVYKYVYIYIYITKLQYIVNRVWWHHGIMDNVEYSQFQIFEAIRWSSISICIKIPNILIWKLQ